MRTLAVSCCSRGRLFLSALGFAGSPQVADLPVCVFPYFPISKNGFWGIAIFEGPFPKKRPPALRGPYPLPPPPGWRWTTRGLPGTPYPYSCPYGLGVGGPCLLARLPVVGVGLLCGETPMVPAIPWAPMVPRRCPAWKCNRCATAGHLRRVLSALLRLSRSPVWKSTGAITWKGRRGP